MYWYILITGLIVVRILDKRFKKRIKTDKGVIGEADVHQEIREYPGYKKTLGNCYLPTDNGTTEIDLILINECGIFVIESKNYGGDICGDENNLMWNEFIPVKGNGPQRYDFYNPLMQNETHIKWLKHCLSDEGDVPIYSLVLFSNRSNLRNINRTSGKHHIANQDSLKYILNDISNDTKEYLSKERINSLYKKLRPYTHVSKAQRKAHIENIRMKYGENKGA